MCSKQLSERVAVFFDRDGTVNEMPRHYPDEAIDSPRQVADLVMLPGAVEALVQLSQAGFALVMVTNQPGVAYGKLASEEVAHAINAEVCRLVEVAGGHIDSVQTCFHTHKAERIASQELHARYYHPNHECRKPAPGMLLAAAEELNLDLSRSYMVGDRAIDAEAGDKAGCGTLILVRNPDYPNEGYPNARVVGSFAEAVRLIMMLHSFRHRRS